uniref:C-type lectin domain-containing protein n=1 Tax=Xiphophorus couchianus TaxID=32473 RepID=A0A3B5LJR3_9TELE
MLIIVCHPGTESTCFVTQYRSSKNEGLHSFLFYWSAPWKTWEQSRRFCQDRRADLVVIDDLQEQVKSNATSWGYWLGLQQTNNTWTWVDGRVDTLGYETSYKCLGKLRVHPLNQLKMNK